MRAVQRSHAARTSALALAAALALAGCTGSGEVSEGARRGGVLSAGGNEVIAPDQRITDIRVTGTTLEGAPVDTAKYAGQVVVLNTWGSWCAPCNAEAPDLQRTWTKVQKQGVQFVGINLNESAVTGRAFQRKYKITYPSLDEGEQVLLQLKGKAPTPPTTLVLDRQGRLAARVLGAVTESTLTAMIDDVLAEPA